MNLKRIFIIIGLFAILYGLFNGLNGTVVLGVLAFIVSFFLKKKMSSKLDIISKVENTLNIDKMMFSGRFANEMEYKIGGKIFADSQYQSLGIIVVEFFDKNEIVYGKKASQSNFKNLGTVKSCTRERNGENVLIFPEL